MILRYYIALGSNLGDREGYIQEAWRAMEATGDMRVVKKSSLLETPPWGNTNQGPFLNAVCEVESHLSPLDMLHTLQIIETACGRVRHEHWGPRTLDLDIISVFDATQGIQVDLDELQVPHPYMWDRLFVLEPLAEIAPGYTFVGERIEDRILTLQKATLD